MSNLPLIDYYSIGIDPGVNGGIAILSPKRELVATTATPSTELAVWAWMWSQISTIRKKHGVKFKACIEQVGGYVPRDRSGMHGKDSGDRGSHMFVFGRSYGAFIMALMALDLYPYMSVVPRVWQKVLSISSREEGESDSQFKNRLKDRAKELYPEYRTWITLSNCDALLLAHYRSIV